MLLCLLAALSVPRCVAEVFSDLTTSSTVDEARALDIKAEQFWQKILQAATEMKMGEHLTLYADVKAVVASLPPDNVYAHKALSEALFRLQRADETVLAQAIQSSQFAAGRLEAAFTGPGDSAMSLFAGAIGDVFARAIGRLADGGEYSQRLVEHVHGRQADVLPVLRSAASATNDVLGDCRLASKRSFDVLKYDLYNKGVPKTPESAKTVAYRLVDAAAETRHRFTRFITETVTGIARDAEGMHDGATATVLRESLLSSSSSSAAALEGAAANSGPSDGEQLISL